MGLQNDICHGEAKHLRHIRHLGLGQHLERHLSAKSGTVVGGMTDDGSNHKLKGHIRPVALPGQRNRSADCWMTGKGQF